MVMFANGLDIETQILGSPGRRDHKPKQSCNLLDLRPAELTGPGLGRIFLATYRTLSTTITQFVVSLDTAIWTRN